MARVVWYVPDHESFGHFILSEQIRKPVKEVCHLIAIRAGELAPRSAVDDDGEHMADKFEVESDGVMTVAENPRVRELVTNGDPASVANEFGGRRNKRHRMLGRAGAAFGDFKPDGGPK